MKMKKIVAGLLATAMVVSGVVVIPKTVDAAVSTEIVAELADAAEMATYCEDRSIPESAEVSGDYLFGGYYKDEALTTPVVDVDWLYSVEEVYLKWVPASVLSIKAQNKAGVTSASTSADIRLISAVDSLDYKEVGFDIEINNDGNVLANVKTTKVFENLKYTDDSNNEKTIKPDSFFGTVAKYFAVWNLTGVPDYGFDDIIYARPYWVTADGTKVSGLSRYTHVEDQYLKLVNVSVNMDVLSDNTAAAGVVEIKTPTGFTFIEAEAGRIFEEMEAAATSNGVKCVGNVEDIGKNANMNDLYINLRFEKSESGVTVGANTFEIVADSIDFCNNAEEKVTLNIWDVLY